MLGSEALSLGRSAGLEDDGGALRRRVRGAVRGRLVVLAVEEDLVDLVGVVGAFGLLPGLGAVFPGTFPESAGG